MTWDEFDAAMQDIDLHLEGGGYTCNWHLANGDTIYDYAHQVLNRSGHSARIIVLSKPDKPPIYLPASSIAWLELVS